MQSTAMNVNFFIGAGGRAEIFVFLAAELVFWSV